MKISILRYCRYRGRKKKALQRALLIAVLVTMLVLTNAVNFLPGQAMQDIADMQNIAELEVIRGFYDNKLKTYRFARQYLVEGDRAVMLCTVGFSPLMGWYDRDWSTVGTNDGNSLHLAYRGHQQGEAYSGYFFGRLDDEKIASVKLRWRDGESEDERWCEETFANDAFFRGENGKRYLLYEAPFGAEDARWMQEVTACAYDHAGTLLTEEEVIWYDWGTSE